MMPRQPRGRDRALAATAESARKTSGTHLTSTATTHRAPERSCRRRRARATASAAETSDERVVVSHRPPHGRRARGSSRRRPRRAPAVSLRAPPRRRPRARRRRQALVEPGGRVGRGARQLGDRLRDPGEDGPVDRGRIAPVGAHVPRGGALGEVGRRVDVRVAAALGGDPAVAPVRPGVRREEERRAERDELHERGDDRRLPCTGDRDAPKEQQPDEVAAEGRDQERRGTARPSPGRASRRRAGRAASSNARRGATPRRRGTRSRPRRRAPVGTSPAGRSARARRRRVRLGLAVLLSAGVAGRRSPSSSSPARRSTGRTRGRFGPRCHVREHRRLPRLREVDDRRAFERRRHEPAPDLRGEAPARDGDAMHVQHRDLATRVAHPDSGREARRVADEPRVRVLVRRAGLARGRPVERRPRPGAVSGRCPRGCSSRPMRHRRERRACGAAPGPSGCRAFRSAAGPSGSRSARSRRRPRRASRRRRPCRAARLRSSRGPSRARTGRARRAASARPACGPSPRRRPGPTSSVSCA